jgi:hypothetical protein
MVPAWNLRVYLVFNMMVIINEPFYLGTQMLVYQIFKKNITGGRIYGYHSSGYEEFYEI